MNVVYTATPKEIISPFRSTTRRTKTITYEALKGTMTREYKGKEVAIKAFWVRVIESLRHGDKVLETKAKEIGPLSPRMGKVRVLCDKMSKNIVVVKNAEEFVSNNFVVIEEEFDKAAKLVVEGGVQRKNSIILRRKKGVIIED